MPKRKVPKTWQTLERAVADLLSPIIGSKLFRNPLSGSNNRRDNGEKRYGDVVFPDDVKLVVECKFRSSIAHHRWLEQAQEDAEKSNVPLDNVVLFTREKGKGKILATITVEMLLRLLEVAKDGQQFDPIFRPGKQPN